MHLSKANWTILGTAFVMATSGTPQAEADRKQRLVEVLPFTNVEEGFVWLVDKALDEIGDETWSAIKDDIKERWKTESDPYSDDMADNAPLAPYWLEGSYNLSKADGGVEIIQSYQGSKLFPSTARGHHYEAWDGSTIRNQSLSGSSAANLIDSEGMNLSGWVRSYELDHRQLLADADGNPYWSEWATSRTSGSWHGTGSAPDMASINAQVNGLNTPTSQFRLGNRIGLVDESWSVGNYYFRTKLTYSPQAHPKVREEPGEFVVTLSGTYFGVVYGGEGTVTDVGRALKFEHTVTCNFNQSASEVEHPIPFDLGPNQRLGGMKSTGSAKRNVFLHNVMGKFERQVPVFSPTGLRLYWNTEEFEAKVNEEYLVREVKFNQP